MSSEETTPSTPSSAEDAGSVPAAKPTLAEQEAAIEAQGGNKNFLLAGIAIVSVAVLALVAYWVIAAAS